MAETDHHVGDVSTLPQQHWDGAFHPCESCLALGLSAWPTEKDSSRIGRLSANDDLPRRCPKRFPLRGGYFQASARINLELNVSCLGTFWTRSPGSFWTGCLVAFWTPAAVE